MAGNSSLPCSPKADRGNLGIGERQLSDIYPERQAPAISRRWALYGGPGTNSNGPLLGRREARGAKNAANLMRAGRTDQIRFGSMRTDAAIGRVALALRAS